MTEPTRVFILGAGFSKPADMPLATELLDLLVKKQKLDKDDEISEWLDELLATIDWLSSNDKQTDSFAVNIEQVFHFAKFDIEACLLNQQLETKGRRNDLGTPAHQAQGIEHWLSNLENDLRDVILKCDNAAVLAPINRWAEAVGEHDAVLTFNYDTLVERALAELGRPWNHGIESDSRNGVSVFKLHGSIDWIVTPPGSDPICQWDLLFDKENVNRPNRNTGHVEDDCRLWRCPTRDLLTDWMAHRVLQTGGHRTVGIAGLGAYKQLHQIPGLGPVWAGGMKALQNADLAVVVGFAMSDFDALAQMQFARVAKSRHRQRRPLRVVVIDPCADEASYRMRFDRVFRKVDFVKEEHQLFDWTTLDGR